MYGTEEQLCFQQSYEIGSDLDDSSATIQRRKFQAQLFHYQLSTGNDEKQQFGMFRVSGMGIVAAFRGTARLYDWCHNLDCRVMKMDGMVDDWQVRSSHTTISCCHAHDTSQLRR